MREIFVVQVEAAPDGISHSPEEFGGAFINIYTSELNIRAAIDLAEQEVIEAGWLPEKIISVALSSREDFPDEDSGLQYFEQTLRDGIVVVVHIYPPEQSETDSFH